MNANDSIDSSPSDLISSLVITKPLNYEKIELKRGSHVPTKKREYLQWSDSTLDNAPDVGTLPRYKLPSIPPISDALIPTNPIFIPLFAPNTDLTMEVVGPLTKGSTVEVSSDEVGFHDAWYVATLVDIVDASPTKKKSSSKKNRNKKKVRYAVKYATLFQDDNLDEPLMEIVEPSFVRPLPPRYPRRNRVDAAAEMEEGDGDGGGHGDCEFQVYDVVDAYLRDGWWIGVVRKVIADDSGEIRKYLVSFESPPEEAEFEGSQMRLHVDWIDGRWQLRSPTTPEQESSDKIATQISKSKNSAHSGFTTPPKVTGITDSGHQTIGGRLSAKKKSYRSRKKKETKGETIGVVDGSATYSRARKIVNLVEENLHETIQSSTGVEKSGYKEKTEVLVSMMEASGSQTRHQDPFLLEQEISIKDTYVTRNDSSQLKRKRGKPPIQPEKPNGLLQENQEAGKRDSSLINENNTEFDEQPICVWYQGLHPLPAYKRSSCSTALDHDEPIDAPNPAMVNDSQTTENHHEWPFEKRSPIWATIESLELYQNLSQSPHFSPLKKTKEDYREGLAIAHMVTFANIIQRITNLQWTDPTHVMNNTLETLVELESNGFDVGPVRVRLSELLAKKSEAGRLESELKEAEKSVEKCNREKMAIDEEINVLEKKMREVEEKMAKAVETKNVKDEEVMMIRSKLQVVSKRIVDWKMGFEELVGSPL